MLVLTRKEGESLYIGEDVKITVVSTDNEKVRIGIEAPQYRRIFREELLIDTKNENQMAVQSDFAGIPSSLKREIKTRKE
jgi:carbon storage regulator